MHRGWVSLIVKHRTLQEEIKLFHMILLMYYLFIYLIYLFIYLFIVDQYVFV